MGPVNTKIYKGRGDATLALKKASEALCERSNINTLMLKMDLLTEEEISELSEILNGADVLDLLIDRMELDLFLTEYSDNE